MFEFFLQFHSGWRFLVILSTLLVAVFFLVALLSSQTKERQEVLVLKIWGGVVDTQFLLGLILVCVMLLDGKSLYRQLWEHMTMGIIAMLIVHVPTFYKRLNGEPTTPVRRIMGLVLPLVVMAVVAIGILTIRTGIFEMTQN